MDISFCIITNGKRVEKISNGIASIHKLNIPNYEIIVAGIVPAEVAPQVSLVIPMAKEASTGKLGAMRNAMIEQAKFPYCVVVDDDITFNADFYTGLLSFGTDFDVVSVRMVNPDGTRNWDWATTHAYGGQKLLSYTDYDAHVYVCGGFCLARKEVLQKAGWNSELGFYRAEDVDFSNRIKEAGYRISTNPLSSVTHNDTNYCQCEDYVVRKFRPDERISVSDQVSVEGSYAFNGSGHPLHDSWRFIVTTQGLNAGRYRLSAGLQSFNTKSYLSWPLRVEFADSRGRGAELVFDDINFEHRFEVEIEIGAEELEKGEFFISARADTASVPLMMGHSRDRRRLSVLLINVSFTEVREQESLVTVPFSEIKRKEIVPESPAQAFIGLYAPCFDFSEDAVFCRALLTAATSNGQPYRVNSCYPDPDYLISHFTRPQFKEKWSGVLLDSRVPDRWLRYHNVATHYDQGCLRVATELTDFKDSVTVLCGVPWSLGQTQLSEINQLTKVFAATPQSYASLRSQCVSSLEIQTLPLLDFPAIQDRGQKEKLRGELGCPNYDFIVGVSVGKSDLVNLKTFLQAFFKANSDPKLGLAILLKSSHLGSSVIVATLQECIAELKLEPTSAARVFIFDQMNQDRSVADVILISDLYVELSSSDYPNAALSAASYGVPMLAMNLGEHLSVVDESSAFLTATVPVAIKPRSAVHSGDSFTLPIFQLDSLISELQSVYANPKEVTLRAARAKERYHSLSKASAEQINQMLMANA